MTINSPPPFSRVSTHAPLAGSDADQAISDDQGGVSTHAPLAGSDGEIIQGVHAGFVSTHAPLAGSDLSTPKQIRFLEQFQPTLPLRGATRGVPSARGHQQVSTHAPLAGSDGANRLLRRVGVVSTHAPLAGSDPAMTARASSSIVSTHAPLAGSDLATARASTGLRLFQPTLPLRGATDATPRYRPTHWSFNPRSPCGERLGLVVMQTNTWTFQPTLPLRERLQTPKLQTAQGSFQPTLPLRGATVPGVARHRLPQVSTHAPLAGSDTLDEFDYSVWTPFQPTLPLRGATRSRSVPRKMRNSFQPTLPLRGATSRRTGTPCRPSSFNPRSPCGERHRVRRAAKAERGFNPRSPCGERLGVYHYVSGIGAFQPTLPLRGATPSSSKCCLIVQCFNPRSPCGERPI